MTDPVAYSPAPLPEKPAGEPSAVQSTDSKNGYQEYIYQFTLDEIGVGSVVTPEIYGTLEYVKIEQTMPSRIHIVSELNGKETVLNTQVGLFDKMHIRARCIDAHGRYFNESTKTVLNQPLKIVVRGSPGHQTLVTIAVTK